jgi:hypothetical protein
MSNALKFGLAVFLLCVFYPPLLGFVFGVSVVMGATFVVYKLLGGT